MKVFQIYHVLEKGGVRCQQISEKIDLPNLKIVNHSGSVRGKTVCCASIYALRHSLKHQIWKGGVSGVVAGAKHIRHLGGAQVIWQYWRHGNVGGRASSSMGTQGLERLVSAPPRVGPHRWLLLVRPHRVPSPSVSSAAVRLVYFADVQAYSAREGSGDTYVGLDLMSTKRS